MIEPYRVQVEPEARRVLSRLPEKVATALIEFVTGTLPANPARLSKTLSGDFEGYRSARRGDYRVIFRIFDDERTVFVVRIGHRADIYRPR